MRHKTLTAALGLLVLLSGLALWRWDAVRAWRVRSRITRVVLVTVDTLNVGFVGAYGGEQRTPHIDALAAEGVLFENAYTTVPITLPAHTSLLTGRSPASSRVMINGDRLPDELDTLAEILSGAGYRTAAFLSLGVLGSRSNLSQGFGTYDALSADRLGRWYRTAPEVFAAAAEWIGRHADEPFFVWMHLSDPHEPHVLPDSPPDSELRLDGELVGRYLLQSKTGQVADLAIAPGDHGLELRSLREPRTDDSADTALAVTLQPGPLLGEMLPDRRPSQGEVELRGPIRLQVTNGSPTTTRARLRLVGRLVDEPVSQALESYPREVSLADEYFGGLRDLVSRLDSGSQRTLWVVCSDHGEGLGRHRARGHARYVWEDQLRILWAMSGPGVARGAKVAEPVLNEDVLPTVLEVLGLPTPSGATGLARRQCWQPSGCQGRSRWSAFGAEHRGPRISAVAVYRWPEKLIGIGTRRPRLFDLSVDRTEGHDLWRRRADGDAGASLLSEATAARQATEALLAGRSTLELESDEIEALRSLGYLGE